MAKRGVQVEIVNALTTTEEFERVRDRDYPKLVVVDVHLAWCGPWEVMAPNFRTMYYEYPNPEERLEIFTIDHHLIKDSSVIEAMGEVTCKPKYLVFSEGEIKGVVDGADYTKIFDLVDKHIPSLEAD